MHKLLLCEKILYINEILRHSFQKRYAPNPYLHYTKFYYPSVHPTTAAAACCCVAAIFHPFSRRKQTVKYRLLHRILQIFISPDLTRHKYSLALHANLYCWFLALALTLKASGFVDDWENRKAIRWKASPANTVTLEPELLKLRTWETYSRNLPIFQRMQNWHFFML